MSALVINGCEDLGILDGVLIGTLLDSIDTAVGELTATVDVLVEFVVASSGGVIAVDGLIIESELVVCCVLVTDRLVTVNN